MAFTTVVKGAAGAVWKLPADNTTTVGELKTTLAARIGVEVARITFLHYGKAISNEEATLTSYDIKDQSVLHLQLSRIENGSVQSVQESSREKDNLERQMSALLDNPLVSSMLSDPKRLRGIMESHPQMKQVMKNNPEIASVLNDDRMMSKMSKYMANPALRRELMRNNDRALANIETIPGGWDALQKMYHSIQAPLQNLSTEQSIPSNEITPDGPALPWAQPSPQQRQRQLEQQQQQQLRNPFSFLNAGGLPSMFGAPPSPPVPTPTPPTPATPSDYSSQLAELKDMGFTDEEANLRALTEAKGDLDAAITLLFPDPNE